MLEQVFREDWGRVVAALVGILGDIELAEDAAQEAFAVAAERWPRDGAPANPSAWLITTARNRAIGPFRRERTLALKTEQLERELRAGSEETVDDGAAYPDEYASADRMSGWAPAFTARTSRALPTTSSNGSASGPTRSRASCGAAS